MSTVVSGKLKSNRGDANLKIFDIFQRGHGKCSHGYEECFINTVDPILNDVKCDRQLLVHPTKLILPKLPRTATNLCLLASNPRIQILKRSERSTLFQLRCQGDTAPRPSTLHSTRKAVVEVWCSSQVLRIRK